MKKKKSPKDFECRPTKKSGLDAPQAPVLSRRSTFCKGLCSVDISRPAQAPDVQTRLGSAQDPVLLARPSAAQAPSFQASPGVYQASVV
jgi:hypothetical protein